MHRVLAEIFGKGQNSGRRSLGDFTRLGLAFYGGLLLISCYQQLRLVLQGVLDPFFSTSLILSALHHLGFAALLSLLLSFPFHFLESRRPQRGMQLAGIVFLGMLGVEFLLTEYFVTGYQVPVPGIPGTSEGPPRYLGLRLLPGMLLLTVWFLGVFRRTGGWQRWISRMYPFTIVLFSLFLATLLSEKRPVNQNKTELVLATWMQGSQRIEKRPADRHPRYGIPPVSARDLVWIHSVFSGNDFDKAYQLARSLAHRGQREEAIRLASHILWEVPGHVDAEILMGRLLSWRESYRESAALLEEAVRRHPSYEDAYAALLDTYFWSGEYLKAMKLKPAIDRHLTAPDHLDEKLRRCREALRAAGLTLSQIDMETAGRSPGPKPETP